MPEQINLTPEQQQHATANLLRDAEWVKDGATIGKAGSLIVTAAQQEEAEGLMKTDLDARANRPEAATAAEMTMSPEKVQETLSEITRSSNIGMEVWLGRGVIEGKGGKFETFAVKNFDYGTPEQTIRDYPTLGAKVAELNAAGISEIVTFTDLVMKPGEDQLVLMSYEVTNRIWHQYDRGHSIKNNYKNGSAFDGATGADLLYGMIMKPDKANELEELITANPENLHLLTDTVVSEGLGGDVDAWHEKGPLYDQWRELSEDGKNRIAIRHDITKPDGPSEILEY